MNYYSPTVLVETTLEHAFETEPELRANLDGILEAHGHGELQAPVVGLLRKVDLLKLFPGAQLADGPVTIIVLPAQMEQELSALATSALFAVNFCDGKQVRRKLYVIGVGENNEIRIDAEAMLQTIDGVADDGLHIIWICGNQLQIAAHPSEEERNRKVARPVLATGYDYGRRRIQSEPRQAGLFEEGVHGHQAPPPVNEWSPAVYRRPEQWTY